MIFNLFNILFSVRFWLSLNIKYGIDHFFASFNPAAFLLLLITNFIFIGKLYKFELSNKFF